MCASRSLDLEPLAVDTSAVAASTKTGIVATAAECTQDQDQLSTTPTAFTKTRSHRNSGALRRTDFDSTSQSPKRQNTTTTSPMTLTGGAAGYSSSPEPPALFVRAMYDYHTDDYTSLSFRQGDVIQVLNQLETGEEVERRGREGEFRRSVVSVHRGNRLIRGRYQQRAARRFGEGKGKERKM